MSSAFPSILRDAYWHCTSVENYSAIILCGNILPEPVSLTRRWGEGLGPEFFPFVRTLGGVSVFDFYGFNPEKYSSDFPSSSWRTFVPGRENWERTIWIKLSRDRMPGTFLSGLDFKALQEERYAFKNKLMPRIECAHLGPIPISAFIEVLQYEKSTGFQEYESGRT